MSVLKKKSKTPTREENLATAAALSADAASLFDQAALQFELAADLQDEAAADFCAERDDVLAQIEGLYEFADELLEDEAFALAGADTARAKADKLRGFLA